MDLNSVFKNEIFQPAVTIVGPGIIAFGPHLWVISIMHPEYIAKAVANSALSSLILILLIAVIGLFLDNIGSAVESHHDVKLQKTPGYDDHLSNWKRYWRLGFKTEPVGHRYLRTIVLKLKFELNTCVALLVAILGLIMLFSVGALTGSETTSIVVISLLCCLKLYSDSVESVKLLSNIRREVLKGVKTFG